jgi:predicted extracellular nuclease
VPRRRRALVSSAVLTIALIAIAVGGAAQTPSTVSPIGLSGTYGPQDFSALASTGAGTAVPDGWAFNETGTNADVSYATGTGSGTAGNTYSFGSLAVPADRAFGTLQSGSLVPTIGAAFTNTTGGTITSLDVAYTGEQWRLGTAGRGADRLDFQYSLNAGDLATGTWTDVDALDFSTPNTSAVGAVDGNTAGNRTAISATIAGLAVPAGATFWIRWTDFNASGADDGLAVDDFSVTAHTGVVNQPVTVTCGGNLATTAGTAASQQISANDPDGTIASITLDSVSPATGAITVDGFTAGAPATATLNVASTATAGTYNVTVRATNDDATPQTTTCSLTVTVTAPPTVLPIGTVQGSVPDTGDATTFDSPYNKQTVTVQGVVTELTREGANNGFYLENTAATADSDPTTSDGVLVFMGSFTTLIGGYRPAVGDEIRLTGKVNEFFHQTELQSASATKLGTAAVTPFTADPPATADAAAVYWERHEGMQASVPVGSIVVSPTHLFASSQDTEFNVVTPTSVPGSRANPYAQRTFRDAHPLDNSAAKIDITDEGIKVADHVAQLVPVHTFQKFAAPVVGGVYFDFGKYSVSANAQPQVVDGADPALNDPPPAFDRSQAFSVANFNMENLYDFRNDPNDACDFTGDRGCAGVSPPFDYVPASDAEYQGREQEIADQIVTNLHSPDVIVVAEAEDQDICSVASDALVCGTADNADGQPDDLEELALKVKALGGGDYATAFDRSSADARGIIPAFMYRTDRVSLVPATAGDAVLGSSPTVQYRGAALAYNNDVSNPKSLNAQLPADVTGDTDGTNVFTRAAQVAHFRINTTTAVGTPSDVWIVANHFSSGPDSRVGQRTEQATYNAAIVKAIQGEDSAAKVMVAGDLNVFPRPDDPLSPPSDQLHSLYDAGLHNLYDTVVAEHPEAAYSYVFDGNAQDLDHQFVTDALFQDLVQVHEAHINSDFPRVPGSNRGTSDHDPMVSEWQLKLDHPPVAHAGGPYAVGEGGSVTLTASATDADGDAVTYAWDLDGNGSYETQGQSVTFAAGDGPATPTVAVQATDSFGLSSTDSATVTVRNVAPTATFHATSPVFAGSDISLSLTNAADPSAADTTAGFEYAFDCGAGAGLGAFSNTSTTTCPTSDVGTRTVRGAIRDKDGGVTTYSASVSVVVTFDSLCALVARYSTNAAVTDGLCSKLAAAADARARGDATAAGNQLKAFTNQVNAQTGKALTEEQAATLLRLLAAL